jgi:polypeptide N-acetylgalactosaminyltransferase
MPSFIIYCSDAKYLDKTIDGILDRTPPTLIDEIIVCDDADTGYSRQGVVVLRTDKIGRAKAWNCAAATARGKRLVFLKAITKVSNGWLQPLMAVLDSEPMSLVSPIVHTLDLALWATEMSRWRRFGWRWDMNLHDRSYAGRPDSPSISSYCIVCERNWFEEIGGFDDGMNIGAGEDIEISLRSWLLGGKVLVCDASSIAVALEVDYGVSTVNNLARIVEVWLPGQANHFYRARGIKVTDVQTGRLNNLIELQGKQKRPVEWFLSTKQPELFSIYDLKGSAAGKTVAVVGPGPSLDYLNLAMINRCDIVIGVDYMGLLVDCDFVMADTVHVINELQQKYAENRFVLPVAVQNRQAGVVQAATELLPLSHQFEMVQGGAVPSSLDPPLCNFESLTLTAVHFALFLGPQSVTLFGCDNKLIGGKSHTSKIDHYDSGVVWPDTETTRRKFAFYEYGLDQLGQLAHSAGIPLLRVCHA